MERYQDINAATIDRWIEEGWEWGRPIGHDEYLRARAGDVRIKLTPTKYVPASWLGELSGKDVLGLCAGGGQQGPVLAAAGARVTIIDYAASQIASERLVAEREGYEIEAIQADVTKGLPFADASFDLVVNPVSICYIREVGPLFAEVWRVLREGGELIAGFDTHLNFVVDDAEERIVWSLPFDPVTNEDQRAFLEADDAGMQFSHTLTDTLACLLHLGFEVLDLFEDTNGEGRLHEMGIPTYVAIRVRKPARRGGV